MAKAGVHPAIEVASEPFEKVVARAAQCTACPLYRDATQTVFGEGPVPAELMLVGEQPGDREDLDGEPFVGPAGRILDEALEEAGLDRERVYLTNVVKHFKWKPRGKRRIHQRPNREEVEACHPWFEIEVARVEPRLILLLGATAAQAVLGSSFRVTKHRGDLIPSELAEFVMATVHPSSVLRAPDDRRRQAFEDFAADVARAVSVLNSQSGRRS
jgi:DNA polymerase